MRGATEQLNIVYTCVLYVHSHTRHQLLQYIIVVYDYLKLEYMSNELRNCCTMVNTDLYCITLHTLPGFWIRRALTAWNTSTVPSVLQQSIALASAHSRPHLLTVLLCVCVCVCVCAGRMFLVLSIQCYVWTHKFIG